MSQGGTAVAQVLINFDTFKVHPRSLRLALGAEVQFRSTGTCKVIKPFLQVVRVATEEVVFSVRELRVGEPTTCAFEQEGQYSFHSEVFPFLNGQVSVGMDSTPERAITSQPAAPQVVGEAGGSISSKQIASDMLVGQQPTTVTETAVTVDGAQQPIGAAPGSPQGEHASGEAFDSSVQSAQLDLPPGEQQDMHRSDLETDPQFQNLRCAVAKFPPLCIPDPSDRAPDEQHVDITEDLANTAKPVTQLTAVRTGPKSGAQSATRGSRAGSGKAGKGTRPGSPAGRNEAQEICSNAAAASAAALQAVVAAQTSSPKGTPRSPGRHASGSTTPTRFVHTPGLLADGLQRSHSLTSQRSASVDLDVRSASSFSSQHLGPYGSRPVLDASHQGSPSHLQAFLMHSSPHSGVRRSQGGCPSPLGRSGTSFTRMSEGQGQFQPDAPSSPARRVPRNSAPVCSPLGLSAPSPHNMVNACTSPSIPVPMQAPSSPRQQHAGAHVMAVPQYGVLLQNPNTLHTMVQHPAGLHSNMGAGMRVLHPASMHAASPWSQNTTALASSMQPSLAAQSRAAMLPASMQPVAVLVPFPTLGHMGPMSPQSVSVHQMPGSPVRSTSSPHQFSGHPQQGPGSPRAQPQPPAKQSQHAVADSATACSEQGEQQSVHDAGKTSRVVPPAHESGHDHEAGCSSREPTSADGHIAVAPDVSALHDEALLGQWQGEVAEDSEKSDGAEGPSASCREGVDQQGSSCSSEAGIDDEDLPYVRLEGTEDESESPSRDISSQAHARRAARASPQRTGEGVSKHTSRLPYGSHFSVAPTSLRVVSGEEGDADLGSTSASSSSSGAEIGRRQANQAWVLPYNLPHQHWHVAPTVKGDASRSLHRYDLSCPTCHQVYVVAFNQLRCQDMHQLLASMAMNQGGADRDLKLLQGMVKAEVLDWLDSDRPRRMRDLLCLDPAHGERNQIVLREYERKHGCADSAPDELKRVVAAGKHLYELLHSAHKQAGATASSNSIVECLLMASEGAALRLTSYLDIQSVTIPESILEMKSIAGTGCAEAAMAYLVETWLLKLVWETRMLQMSSARARLNTLLRDSARDQVERMVDAIWKKGHQPYQVVRNLETLLTSAGNYHNQTLPSADTLQEMACLVPAMFRAEFLEGIKLSGEMDFQAGRAALHEEFEAHHLRDSTMLDARPQRSITSSMQGYGAEGAANQHVNPMRHYASMWDGDDFGLGHPYAVKDRDGPGSSAYGAGSSRAGGLSGGLARSASGRESSNSRNRATSKEAGRAMKNWTSCNEMMNAVKEEGMNWNWEQVFMEHGMPDSLHVPSSDKLLAFNKKDDWTLFPKIMPTSATCSGCGTRYNNELNAHRCEQRHKEVHGDAALHSKAGHAGVKGGGKLSSRKSQGALPVDSRAHDLKAFWARLVSSQPAAAAAVLALRPLTHDANWPESDAYGSSPASDFWRAAVVQLLELVNNWVLLGKTTRRTSHYPPDTRCFYIRMYGLSLCIHHARTNLDHIDNLKAADPSVSPPEPHWVLPPWDDICACLRVVTEGTMLTFTATQPGQVLNDFIIKHISKVMATQPYSRRHEVHAGQCPDAALALLLELSLMTALQKEHERAEALSRSLLLAEEEADAASKRKQQQQAAAVNKDKNAKQKAARKAASNRGSSHAPSHADTSSEDEDGAAKGADGEDTALSTTASGGGGAGGADGGSRHRAIGGGGGDTEGSSDVMQLGPGHIPLLGSQLDEAVRNLELQQSGSESGSVQPSGGSGQLQRRDSGGAPSGRGSGSGQHQPSSELTGLQRKHSGTSSHLPQQQSYPGGRQPAASGPFGRGVQPHAGSAAYGVGQVSYGGRQQGGRGGRGPAGWVDTRGLPQHMLQQTGMPMASRPPRGDTGFIGRTGDVTGTSAPQTGVLVSRPSSGSEQGGGRRAPSPGSAAGTTSISPVTSVTAPVVLQSGRAAGTLNAAAVQLGAQQSAQLVAAATQQLQGRRTSVGPHGVPHNLPAAVEDALSFMSTAATAVAEAQSQPVVVSAARAGIPAQQAAARSQLLQRPVQMAAASGMLQSQQSGPAAVLQLPSPAQGRAQAGRGGKAGLQRFPSSSSSSRDHQEGGFEVGAGRHAAAAAARDGTSSGMSSRSTTSAGIAPTAVAAASHVAMAAPSANTAAHHMLNSPGMVQAAQHAQHAQHSALQESGRSGSGMLPAAVQLPQGHMLHMLPPGMSQHPHASMMAGMMPMQPMWVPSPGATLPGMPQAGHMVLPYGVQGAPGQPFMQYIPVAMHPGMHGMMQHQAGIPEGMAAMQAYGVQGMAAAAASQQQPGHHQHVAAGMPGHVMMAQLNDQRAAASQQQHNMQPSLQYYMMVGPDGHSVMVAAPMSHSHPSTQPPPPPSMPPSMQSPVMLQGAAYPGTAATAASAAALHALPKAAGHSITLASPAHLQVPASAHSPLPSPAGLQAKEHAHERAGRTSSLTSPHPRHQPTLPVQSSAQDVRTTLAHEHGGRHGGRGGKEEHRSHEGGGRGGGRGGVPSGPYAIPVTQPSAPAISQKPVTASAKPQQPPSSSHAPVAVAPRSSAESAVPLQQPASVAAPVVKPKLPVQPTQPPQPQQKVARPSSTAPAPSSVASKQQASAGPHVAKAGPAAMHPPAPAAEPLAPPPVAPPPAAVASKQGGNVLTALLKTAFARGPQPQPQPPAVPAQPTLSSHSSVDAAVSRTHSQHQGHPRGFQADKAADQLHSRWAQALAEMEEDT